MKKKTLIIGIGNVGRTDDGAGVHVINSILNSEIPLPEDVEIIDAGCAIYDVLPAMMGRKKVIIIDALQIDDIPGSIYRIHHDDFRSGYWNLLSGSPELREIIFQLYAVSGEVELEFIGIVPGDVSGCSLELTEQVSESLGRAVDLALDAVLC
ncbi:MAG TPA: hydrogenase maturation protease [Spirochaetota bacterium]|nr:hydrogenase maturation protease [Spirochaetota bacterium]HPJ35787.1 hydrogenase maturation protease [Spirochaetota bacterium]